MNAEPILRVQGLKTWFPIRQGIFRRVVGHVRAVDGVDLAVPAGTVYGVLGPNGAGKTTTIRMLATLLQPDGGRARVLGHDIVTEAGAVRAQVSLTGQLASERKHAAARLRHDLGKHVGDIAGKYLIPGETQDLALMFVPSESIYAELHEGFDDILQKAYRSRVVIVSPSLLMLAIRSCSRSRRTPACARPPTGFMPRSAISWTIYGASTSAC